MLIFMIFILSLIEDISFKTVKAELVRDSGDYAGCQPPSKEERQKNKQEGQICKIATTIVVVISGNCWNGRTCKFMKNGEVLQSSGDQCKVLYCSKYFS